MGQGLINVRDEHFAHADAEFVINYAFDHATATTIFR